jgi:hypothetical protein
VAREERPIIPGVIKPLRSMSFLWMEKHRRVPKPGFG